jgi:acyl carrier protein
MDVELNIEPPATEMERKLAEIWASLLKVDISRIGRHTSFFELGGDSISAIQVASQCKLMLDLNLSTSAIFKRSILKLMAAPEEGFIKRELPPIVVS